MAGGSSFYSSMPNPTPSILFPFQLLQLGFLLQRPFHSSWLILESKSLGKKCLWCMSSLIVKSAHDSNLHGRALPPCQASPYPEPEWGMGMGDDPSQDAHSLLRKKPWKQKAKGTVEANIKRPRSKKERENKDWAKKATLKCWQFLLIWLQWHLNGSDDDISEILCRIILSMETL